MLAPLISARAPPVSSVRFHPSNMPVCNRKVRAWRRCCYRYWQIAEVRSPSTASPVGGGASPIIARWLLQGQRSGAATLPARPGSERHAGSARADTRPYRPGCLEAAPERGRSRTSDDVDGGRDRIEGLLLRARNPPIAGCQRSMHAWISASTSSKYSWAKSTCSSTHIGKWSDIWYVRQRA